MALSEIDEDLNRLERDIRQLKIEFEQYFGGGRPRPPNDTEWRIETVLKRYGDRDAEMSYGQRFRFGNLAQTYTRFRDVFHKRLQRREEGSVDRHFGSAAKAIEAERARVRAATAPTASANQGSPASATVSCADPGRDPGKLDELYGAFRNALEQSGESVDRLSRETFERFLRQKMVQLREKQGDREIEFVVSVEDGKARLKARVRS